MKIDLVKIVLEQTAEEKAAVASAEGRLSTLKAESERRKTESESLAVEIAQIEKDIYAGMADVEDTNKLESRHAKLKQQSRESEFWLEKFHAEILPKAAAELRAARDAYQASISKAIRGASAGPREEFCQRIEAICGIYADWANQCLDVEHATRVGGTFDPQSLSAVEGFKKLRTNTERLQCKRMLERLQKDFSRSCHQ